MAHVFTVRQVDRRQAAALVGLPQLLIDVVDGGASVGFLAPLSPQLAAEYWDNVVAELGAHLHLLVAEAEDTHGVAFGRAESAGFSRLRSPRAREEPCLTQLLGAWSCLSA